jgi:hypothetical protein
MVPNKNEIRPEEAEMCRTRRAKLSKIVMVAAAGAAIVYAIKKHRSKRKWYQIEMR